MKGRVSLPRAKRVLTLTLPFLRQIQGLVSVTLHAPLSRSLDNKVHSTIGSTRPIHHAGAHHDRSMPNTWPDLGVTLYRPFSLCQRNGAKLSLHSTPRSASVTLLARGPLRKLPTTAGPFCKSGHAHSVQRSSRSSDDAASLTQLWSPTAVSDHREAKAPL